MSSRADGPKPSETAQIAARAAVLLRVARSEVQLTKALAGLMQEDRRLAHKMAQGLLSLSKDPSVVAPQALRVVGEDPTKRKPVLRAEQATGRVDWRFSDHENESGFQLLVEVKIASKFDSTQLERYLSDSTLKHAARGGVIALTRDAAALPQKVTRHRRWLGLVRWKDLLPKLRLEPGEEPSVDGLLWEALIDVAEQRGDLGTDLPTWDELLSAEGNDRDLIRGQIARAAIDELLPRVRDRMGYARRVPTRGPRAWLSVSSEDWFFSVEIPDDVRTTVSAVAYVPAPPIGKRREWRAAVHRCLEVGWRVDRHRLRFLQTELSSDCLPHAAVASALSKPLDALLDPILLPRLLGLSAPPYARSKDLSGIA